MQNVQLQMCQSRNAVGARERASSPRLRWRDDLEAFTEDWLEKKTPERVEDSGGD